MEKEKSTDKTTVVGSLSGNLPVARVGHPYRVHIDEECLSINPLIINWFEGLDDIGLHFVPEKRQITGIPKKSGQFEIHLHQKKYVDTNEESIPIRTFNLLVHEDSLFIPLEDTPLDENDPYWKSDEEVAFHLFPSINNGRKKKEQKKSIAAASKRGRSHAMTAKFRDDDFDLKYDIESQWYVLAVADGAGTAKFSRKGSQIACETVVASCFEQLATQSLELDKLAETFAKENPVDVCKKITKILHGIISSSVIKAYQDIELEAEHFVGLPDDYATTLLLSVCKRFDFGWLVGAFGVGDGAICVYNNDTWYTKLLNIPDGGECSPPKRYLTTPGIAEPVEVARRINIAIVQDFSALFMMTNGISDPKFETDTNLQYFEMWNRFWKDITSEVDFTHQNKNVGEKLLKWLDFWTPGKHDDRTIIVVF